MDNIFLKRKHKESPKKMKKLPLKTLEISLKTLETKDEKMKTLNQFLDDENQYVNISNYEHFNHRNKNNILRSSLGMQTSQRNLRSSLGM